MTRRIALPVAAVMVTAGLWVGPSETQGAVPAALARQLYKALSKTLGKEGAEELSKFGGKKGLQELLERAAREGGEELCERTMHYGSTHGLAALRAIKLSPKAIVAALDELPAQQIPDALQAISREPTAMTELVERHGADVLRAELRIPGVGARFAERLDGDGLRLANALNKDQGIAIARCMDDLAQLPPNDRKSVVEAILRAPAKAVEVLEKSPKVLADSDGVLIFLQLMQPDVERRYDEKGNLLEEDRQGLLSGLLNKLGSGIQQALDNTTYWVGLAFVALALPVGVAVAIRLARFRRQAARSDTKA